MLPRCLAAPPMGRCSGCNARAEELTPYLGLVVAQGEVYVAVLVEGGDAAVEVSLSDERPEEAIPDVLRYHL
jgi:hypothetical protein